MIKAIIFDLDGVLIDSKEVHYIALNQALKLVDNKYKISMEDHLNIFDGLPTLAKINYLIDKRNFPKSKKNFVYNEKQKITNKLLVKDVSVEAELKKILNKLSKKFKLALATNCIRKTMIQVLKKNDIKKYFQFTICNEDVNNPKPHSEIYLKCILNLGYNPDEVLILEDSNIGRTSAIKSGANVLPIEDFRKDVNYKNIINKISSINEVTKKIKWKSEKLNILIPMSGKGSRFMDKGYIFPKPLIEVNKKPMIEVVIENLQIEANFIFIVLKEHIAKYKIDYFLKRLNPNCKIVVCDNITEGAACTSLLAEKLINNSNPLIIANSDQYIEWDSSKTMYSIVSSKVDGAILTFKSNHPKWSYALTDKENNVVEVAEKKPISDNATVGIYYWSKGSDYVKYAKKMIKKNIRVNGEFYICPVYNQAIIDKKKIITKEVKEMWGIGTPEDLEYFLMKKEPKINKTS